MKPLFVIIGLLVAASAAIAPCAILAGMREPRWEGGADVMRAVGLAQIALLAVWAAWGRRFAVLRLAALVAGIAGWGWPLAYWNPAHKPAPDQWMFALMCYAGVIVLALAAVRACGWSFRNEHAAQCTTSTSRRHQFSLWDLFSLVTSAALVAGFLTWVQVPWRSLLDMSVFVALLAAPVIVCVLTGFACRRPSRLLLCLIPALASAIILSGLSPSGRNYLLLVALLCGYVLLATQALRSGGMKLRPPTNTAPVTPANPAAVRTESSTGTWTALPADDRPATSVEVTCNSNPHGPATVATNDWK